MQPRLYRFHSAWAVDASREKVWQTMTATPFSWPQWWPELRNVHNVNLESGIAGSSFSCTWRARGYQLQSDITVGETDYPYSVVLSSKGDLVGTANCHVDEAQGATVITMDWEVQTTKQWMNYLAPILGPVFAWNHHRIMKHGEQGFQKYIASTAKSPA